MITLAILCLIGLAGATLLNCRRTTAIMILVTLIAFEAVGSGWIPSLLLGSLQSTSAGENPAWGERNVIIVLGDGTVRLPGRSIVKPSALSYSRILEAVRLYSLAKKSNHQCNILISGGDASGTGVTEAEAYRTEVTQLGVTDSDVILERRSMNTFQNAEFTESILHEQQFDRLFLVTSGLHLRRALLYFGYFNIHPTPCSADYVVPPISILPTGYNFAIADLAAHEYVGILRYYIYNLLGWNPKAASKGSAARETPFSGQSLVER